MIVTVHEGLIKNSKFGLILLDLHISELQGLVKLQVVCTFYILIWGCMHEFFPCNKSLNANYKAILFFLKNVPIKSFLHFKIKRRNET